MMLVVLFGGGLIVSVKIGGGSNLHNFDAFLSLLMILCCYFYFDKFQTDQPILGSSSLVPNWQLLSIFLVVIGFTLVDGNKLDLPPQDVADQKLDMLRDVVTPIVNNGGEVLFISQRHLVTFDLISDVSLIPEYEKVFLMEMVMSRNKPYLNQFYSDIENHRFDLIIMDPLPESRKGKMFPFNEENNLWFDAVSEPILQEYQILALSDQVGYDILHPIP
jgi:hypothetical protein